MTNKYLSKIFGISVTVTMQTFVQGSYGSWKIWESPGILFWHFPGLESPGKRPLVLESSGNLLNSTKCSKSLLWNLFTVAIKPNYLEVYGRP